jgi:hypothetical protein
MAVVFAVAPEQGESRKEVFSAPKAQTESEGRGTKTRMEHV